MKFFFFSFLFLAPPYRTVFHVHKGILFARVSAVRFYHAKTDRREPVESSINLGPPCRIAPSAPISNARRAWSRYDAKYAYLVPPVFPLLSEWREFSCFTSSFASHGTPTHMCWIYTEQQFWGSLFRLRFDFAWSFVWLCPSRLENKSTSIETARQTFL